MIPGRGACSLSSGNDFLRDGQYRQILSAKFISLRNKLVPEVGLEPSRARQVKLRADADLVDFRSNGTRTEEQVLEITKSKT